MDIFEIISESDHTVELLPVVLVFTWTNVDYGINRICVNYLPRVLHLLLFA